MTETVRYDRKGPENFRELVYRLIDTLRDGTASARATLARKLTAALAGPCDEHAPIMPQSHLRGWHQTVRLFDEIDPETGGAAAIAWGDDWIHIRPEQREALERRMKDATDRVIENFLYSEVVGVSRTEPHISVKHPAAPAGIIPGQAEIDWDGHRFRITATVEPSLEVLAAEHAMFRAIKEYHDTGNPSARDAALAYLGLPREVKTKPELIDPSQPYTSKCKAPIQNVVPRQVAYEEGDPDPLARWKAKPVAPVAADGAGEG